MNCSYKQDCPEGINFLPMYGELKKCDEQLKVDSEFLEACDREFKNRKEASQKYIEKAWGYFYNNDAN